MNAMICLPVNVFPPQASFVISSRSEFSSAFVNRFKYCNAKRNKKAESKNVEGARKGGRKEGRK
jgi:hypothetical protein